MYGVVSITGRANGSLAYPVVPQEASPDWSRCVQDAKKFCQFNQNVACLNHFAGKLSQGCSDAIFSCSEDSVKYCPNAIPSTAEERDCCIENKDELSQTCMDAIPLLPRLYASEMNIIYTLMDLADKITKEKGASLFLGTGSLTGSVLHHDIIPWDLGMMMSICLFLRKGVKLVTRMQKILGV